MAFPQGKTSTINGREQKFLPANAIASPLRNIEIVRPCTVFLA